MRIGQDFLFISLVCISYLACICSLLLLLDSCMTVWVGCLIIGTHGLYRSWEYMASKSLSGRAGGVSIHGLGKRISGMDGRF